jgi:hypothetical protein
MCFGSTPDAPPPPPPPPQALKSPVSNPIARRNKAPGDQGGMGVPMGSTLLTGATGIDAASLNLGKTSLLGGGG